MSDKAPRENSVEPVPKRQDFFEWLERLFDGSTQYPEKIEINPVAGAHNDRIGPTVKQLLFAPQTAANGTTSSDKPEGTAKPSKIKTPGRGKPSKEDLVHLSNEILFFVQRESNESRRTTLYGVHVYHFSLGDNFYERFLIRTSPQGIRATEESRGEDDDGMPTHLKYAAQALSHDEQMHVLARNGIEGLFDRYYRDKEHDRLEIESLRNRIRELEESLARALSLEHTRKMELMWQEAKIGFTNKGADLVFGLAPTLVNQLAGKTVVPTKESPESLVLKQFFKPQKDGGRMTVEQGNEAFGTYADQPPHDLTKPGVLSLEQAKLLWDVANCNVSPGELDKLLPGGELMVTQEQVTALQGIFSMEQLMPVMVLIGERLRKHQQQ